jgi:ketosteroid isomerase-like protein
MSVDYFRKLNPLGSGAVIIGLILLGATLQSGLADSEPADSNPGLVVEAREIAFAKTMADRDFEAFKEFISDEAIFFNGNEALRGKSAVIAGWAPYFEGEDAPFSWHPDTVEALDSGQLGISSGPVYSTTGEVVGRFNSIWRKEVDGQWRVVFDKGS